MDFIADIFRFIFQALFQWHGWIVLAGLAAFFAWQNTRRAKWIQASEYQLLRLEIPRTNDKKELAAEQMFAALHGILRPRGEIVREASMQEHISFEIAAISKHIQFYVWIPKHLQNFVEGQIYAQYPEVQIYEEESDYAKRDISEDTITHTAELTLNSTEVLPIKTFPSFEVDPLAAITATLSKLETESEEVWVQIMARPIDDSWHRKGASYISNMKKGRGGISADSVTGLLQMIGKSIAALFNPPTGSDKGAPAELSERQRTQIQAVEDKSSKLGYQTSVRIAYVGNDRTTAKLRMQAIVGAFKQFNSTNLNGFKIKSTSFDTKEVDKYKARYFTDKGFTLNIEELASIWHLPHTNVETPNIVWANTKTAEPPSNLPSSANTHPKELSLFGTTNFRGNFTQFGLKREDRGRHIYAVGQTGTGKSGLLQLLTLSDIYYDHGFAIIDPHGDYAQSILEYIPSHRIDDVIYFNPSDTDYPIGFNPLEVTDPSLKTHISSELVGVLKRMFDSWGPRLEYILRYTILALLDYPNSTMLDITRMLTDSGFRKKVLKQVQDPVVYNFWVNEFGSWNQKFAAEAVSPVLNKVGAFTANPMIRNIVGQPKSSFNIRQAMDEGKILIVNLSRGLVGEDNAAILGALMVTKIQLAAMSRANLATLEERRPFYLYVDEFQNFATDSFAVILSEARKYGLNLTVANQYVSQMTPEVKDAVFGNVGSLVAFRVGADDAAALQKYVEPQFDSQDLINLHNRHFLAALTIEGERAHAFSATTLNLPPPEENYQANIIENSRNEYTKPRQIVEKQIHERTKHTQVQSQPKPQPGKKKKTPQSGYKKRVTHHTKPQEPAPPVEQLSDGAGEFEDGQVIKLR